MLRVGLCPKALGKHWGVLNKVSVLIGFTFKMISLAAVQRMACKKQNGRQGDQLEVIAEVQVVQVMEHGDGRDGEELQKQMPRQPRRSTKLLIKALEQDFLQLPHYSYFL